MITKEVIQKLRNLFFLKVKFASSSVIATVVDYSLFLLLVNRFFSPVVSNVISASTGMIINFFLQKKFVFKLNRKSTHAFALSVLVSLGGIFLGTTFIHFLNKLVFFSDNQYITKLIVTGTIFFYNFYLKRFSFEKKFI